MANENQNIGFENNKGKTFGQTSGDTGVNNASLSALTNERKIPEVNAKGTGVVADKPVAEIPEVNAKGTGVVADKPVAEIPEVNAKGTGVVTDKPVAEIPEVNAKGTGVVTDKPVAEIPENTGKNFGNPPVISNVDLNINNNPHDSIVNEGSSKPKPEPKNLVSDAIASVNNGVPLTLNSRDGLSVGFSGTTNHANGENIGSTTNAIVGTISGRKAIDEDGKTSVFGHLKGAFQKTDTADKNVAYAVGGGVEHQVNDKISLYSTVNAAGNTIRENDIKENVVHANRSVGANVGANYNVTEKTGLFVQGGFNRMGMTDGTSHNSREVRLGVTHKVTDDTTIYAGGNFNKLNGEQSNNKGAEIGISTHIQGGKVNVKQKDFLNDVNVKEATNLKAPERKVVEKISFGSKEMFAHDKDNLSVTGQSNLDKLAHDLTTIKTLSGKTILDEMKERGIPIKLTGFADATGGDKYNQDLSERRVKVVQDYLVSKGVPANMFQSAGKGETEAQYDNNQILAWKKQGLSRAQIHQRIESDRRTDVEIPGEFIRLISDEGKTNSKNITLDNAKETLEKAGQALGQTMHNVAEKTNLISQQALETVKNTAEAVENKAKSLASQLINP